MKKRKKKTLKTVNLLLGMLTAAFGIVATCMLFADSISFLKEDWTFTGAQVAFGYSEGSGIWSLTFLNFNIVATLAYFLPLAGGVLAVLFRGRLGTILSFLCFVVAAVLLFLMPEIGKLCVADQFSSISDAITFELGIGAILGGAFSAAGAVATAVKGLLR